MEFAISSSDNKQKSITDDRLAKARGYDVIRGRNEAEERGRPFGDRSVEWDFSFVCNNNCTPRVGYVGEKQLLIG